MCHFVHREIEASSIFSKHIHKRIAVRCILPSSPLNFLFIYICTLKLFPPSLPLSFSLSFLANLQRPKNFSATNKACGTTLLLAKREKLHDQISQREKKTWRKKVTQLSDHALPSACVCPCVRYFFIHTHSVPS